MSKFRQLILEAFEELAEAPKANANQQQNTNKNNQSQAQNNAQPNDQTANQDQNVECYIKASGHIFKQHAGKDFYFYDFETHEDGQTNPIFLNAEDKRFATKFPSAEEAQQTLDKLYAEAPIYKRLFQNIQVTSVEDDENGVTNQNTAQNTQDQEKPLKDEPEQQPSKFKQFLTQSKDELKTIFQNAKTSTKELTDTISKVLNGQSTGNPKIDQAVINLKNAINQSKQALNKVATKAKKYI